MKNNVTIILAGFILFSGCVISKKEYYNLRKDKDLIMEISDTINSLNGGVLVKNAELNSSIAPNDFKGIFVADTIVYYSFFKKFTYSDKPGTKQIITIYSLSCDTCNLIPTIAENEIMLFDENAKRINSSKIGISRIAPSNEIDRLSFHIITKWQFEIPPSGKVSVVVFVNNLNFEKEKKPFICFDKSYKRIMQSVHGNFMITIQDVP